MVAKQSERRQLTSIDSFDPCDVVNDEEEFTTMELLEIESNDDFNNESVTLLNLQRFNNLTKALKVIAFMGKFISKLVERYSKKGEIFRSATSQNSQPRLERLS